MNEILLNSPATLIIIITTTILSWLYFRLPEQKRNEFMFFPYHLYYNKSYLQLFSSIFVHADWGHFLLNMISFYFFAPFMEQELGSSSLILIYFVSAISGSLALVVRHKNNSRYCALGASGAVSGIVFAYIALYPMAKLGFIFIPVSIPAFLFGIIYLLISFYRAKSSNDRIAHEAHIGGAIAGLISIRLLIL
jgi:membrane associated rhomboid family serine protease